MLCHTQLDYKSSPILWMVIVLPNNNSNFLSFGQIKSIATEKLATLRQMWPTSSSTSSRFCYHFGILVAGLVLRATADVTCPEGWLTYKDCCYGLFTGKKKWFDAEFDCQRHAARSHLASILDAEEMDAVADFIAPISERSGGTGPIWIGLFDHNQVANWFDANSPPDPNERDWQWKDAFKITYLPWAEGEPNNAGSFEPCVHLLPQEGFKKWNDADCTSDFAWLCKYELKYQRG